ncbi:hypothetical protein AKJ08_0030 [Vulgatibacter incomptus]|uniref:Uncharacterized protein n=1 Tax=Vulgatibacter incomptus TaxID=1391653 RepID=A0A0K1P7Y0_9BACT|nr:hypothetical protein AKJ08_0030 [Vulgatibacter incomptus]
MLLLAAPSAERAPAAGAAKGVGGAAYSTLIAVCEGPSGRTSPGDFDGMIADD